MKIHQALKWLVQDSVVHTLVASILCGRVWSCITGIVAALIVERVLLSGKEALNYSRDSLITEKVL